MSSSPHDTPTARVIYFLLAGLLVFFAFLQLNDPDPARWVLAYGFAGMASLFAALSFPLRLVVMAGGIVYAIGLVATTIFMIRDYTGELLNEFGGLSFCLALMIWLMRHPSFAK